MIKNRTASLLKGNTKFTMTITHKNYAFQMFLFFLFLILFPLVFSGCQPNPYEDCVTETVLPSESTPSLPNENIDYGLVQSVSPFYTETKCFSEDFLRENNFVQREHIVADYTNNDESLIINIDADVFMPEVQSFPIVKFEPRFFTQKEVESIVGSFTHGEPLYKDGVFEETANTDIFSTAQKWVGGQYILDENYNAKLHILNDPNDGSARVVMNAINKESEEPLILYSRDWRNYNVTDIEGQPEDITMSPEEAMMQADAFFRQLGLSDDVKISQIELLITDYVTCYEVKLLRYIDDIPIIYVHTPISAHEKINFITTPRTPSEEMVVYINDSGILRLEWNAPLTQLEAVEGNAKLRSYNDISDDFIDQIDLIYSSNSCFYNFDIKLMCLNYGLARIPDSDNQFFAIPLWDFFGVKQQHSFDVITILTHNFGITDQINYGFMTIDAVSGNLFNRDTGS